MAQKYTTEGKRGVGRLGISKTEGGISKSEPVDDRSSLTQPRSNTTGQSVDTSVRLGPLTGPAAHGEVDMATTMRKPQAYRK